MNGEAVLGGNFLLSRFNGGIVKLFQMSALHAYDVVVMLPVIQFEYRFAPFEIMAHQYPRQFELGQHAVYRGQTHILAAGNKQFVNILCAQVMVFAAFEQVQNFKPGQGDF